MKRIALLALFALIAGGCASFRPAASARQNIPVLKATPLPVDSTAMASSGSAATTSSMVADSVGMGKAARSDGLTVVEPTPVDDLALPEDAFPQLPDSLDKKGFIPSSGPQQPGQPPPTLGEGWKVQVGSYTDKQVVNAADAEVKMKHPDLPVHLRYLEDHYILLVGNFIQKESADSLRDILRAGGYTDAFVVQAPVITGPGNEEADSSTVPAPAETDTVMSEPVQKTVPGFRIQVMSVGSRTAAEQEAKKAEVRTGFRAYIAEVDGVYKVRLGNFTAKLDANSRLDRL
ncbi:MAG: SPOR domain-containing protein, partial [bacterium]